jgi:hypothetical protein
VWAEVLGWVEDAEDEAAGSTDRRVGRQLVFSCLTETSPRRILALLIRLQPMQDHLQILHRLALRRFTRFIVRFATFGEFGILWG